MQQTPQGYTRCYAKAHHVMQKKQKEVFSAWTIHRRLSSKSSNQFDEHKSGDRAGSRGRGQLDSRGQLDGRGHYQGRSQGREHTPITLMNRNFEDLLQKQISKSADILRSLQTSPKEIMEIQQQWSHMMPKLTPEILHGKVIYQIHGLARTALDWETAPASFATLTGPRGRQENTFGGAIPLTVNTAIQAWGKIGNSQQAEELVMLMLQRQDSAFAPNYETYVSLMDAFGKSGDSAKAVDWMNRMPHHLKRPSNISPARIHNSVLNAYSKNGQAEQATVYLQHMKDKRNIEPDSYSYSAIILAWKNSHSPDARLKVEIMLETIKENYRTHRLEANAPNAALIGVSMSMAVSPKSCERMLNDLIQMYHNSNRSKMFEPNERHFMTTMNMFAKAGEAKITEELFQKMEQLYFDGLPSCRPTYRTFLIVVDAYCKKNTLESSHYARMLLDRLQNLFRKDINSNWGYNMVMDAYIKSTNDARYVEEIYQRMLEISEEYPSLLPDKITYTCLMKAWIQEGKPGFPDQIDELLTRMEQSPQNSTKPDQVTFGVVLDGLDQSGVRDACNRADIIVRRMRDQGISLNRVIFNSLLGIRVKEGGPESAEELLREMDSNDFGNDCRPSAEIFTTIILAWARSERSDQCFDAAVRLLEEQVHRFNAGEYLCKPQEMTLTAMLSALASSSENNKAERARVLLGTFEKLFSVVPNRITLSAVINVCSKEVGDEPARNDALAMAVATFQKIRQTNNSDAAIYGAILDACYNLPSRLEDKERAMSEAFTEICDDGNMHPSVLYIFRRAFPDSPLLEGIENDSSIPPSWTRSI